MPPRAEAIYRVTERRVDTDAAMAIVTRMAPLWRLAGNPQFDQALESIDAKLRAAGIATHFDTIASTSQGWEMRDAVLRLDGEAGEVVLSKAQDRLPLAINSFSTTVAGRRLRLIDAGRGVDAKDYAGLRVAGAVVLADGPIGPVWNQAVKARGAAGVISTEIDSYARPEATPEVLQWGAIPYNAQRASFGFKATPRAAKRLRERLATGDVGTFTYKSTRCFIVGPFAHWSPSFPARAGPTTESYSSRTCRSLARTTTPAAPARWSRLHLRSRRPWPTGRSLRRPAP